MVPRSFSTFLSLALLHFPYLFLVSYQARIFVFLRYDHFVLGKMRDRVPSNLDQPGAQAELKHTLQDWCKNFLPRTENIWFLLPPLTFKIPEAVSRSILTATMHGNEYVNLRILDKCESSLLFTFTLIWSGIFIIASDLKWHIYYCS